MQIKMTSGGMKLLDHGTVFLAETNGDLRLNITADNAFAFTLVLQFDETDKTWSYRWKEYVFYVLVLSVW